MNTDGDSFSGIARLKSEIELMRNFLKHLEQNFQPHISVRFKEKKTLLLERKVGDNPT